MALLILASAGLASTNALGQGGTGKTKPAPSITTKTRPPVNRPATADSLVGSMWVVEGFEGGKSLGKGLFEFLSGGQLRTDGEIDPSAQWKQTGRRIVITFTAGGVSTMDGLITGDRMNGSVSGTDRDGTRHSATWKGQPASAEVKAEFFAWQSIKKSNNADDFNQFLTKYPDGIYAKNAKENLQMLEAAKPATTPSPTPEPAPSKEPVITTPNSATQPFNGDEQVYQGKDVDQRAQVTSKPKPSYTENARKNLVSGTVILSAVLSASGEVKDIRVVQGLSDGLTEQAIAAARQIKFTPAIKNGHAVSQSVRLEYNFSPY